MSELEARDQALEVLYQADRTGQSPELTGLSPRARRLVRGVEEHCSELDGAIDSASDHWRTDRMPVIDLTILRLGLYELRSRPDVPVAVIVNEAVRLAKTYSTQRSGAFVNGVLAALAEQERPPGERPRDPAC